MLLIPTLNYFLYTNVDVWSRLKFETVQQKERGIKTLPPPLFKAAWSDKHGTPGQSLFQVMTGEAYIRVILSMSEIIPTVLLLSKDA